MSNPTPKTDVRIEGVLVSPVEFDYTQEGQPRCRFVFLLPCSGLGEVNSKPYWLPVVCFGALAEQAKGLTVGQEVVTFSRINANRWIDKNDGVTVKTSQNYIAYRVGVVKMIGEPVEWFPGAPRKAKAKTKQAVLQTEPGEMPEGEPEAVNDGVSDFLHGQAEANSSAALHDGGGSAGALGLAPAGGESVV